MAWSQVQSNNGTSSTAGTTFGVAFSTSNIVSGNRIILVAVIWNSTATTVSSVTDTPGNAYALDKRVSVSDNTDVTLWSGPITAGGGTKPTVTLHASGSTAEWALIIVEYSGLNSGTSGYLDGTAGTASAAPGSPFSSGATSPAPGASNELAVGGYGDGGNNTTITVGAGWSNFIFTGAASATSEAAHENQNSTSGTGSNAGFGLSPTGSPAGALAAIYKLAAAAAAIWLPDEPRRRPTVYRVRRSFVAAAPRAVVTSVVPAPPPEVRHRLLVPKARQRSAAAAQYIFPGAVVQTAQALPPQQPRARRWWMPDRVLRVMEPPWPQAVQPLTPAPPQAPWPRRRLLWLRRARTADVPAPTIVPVPQPPPRRRLLFAWPRRARVASVPSAGPAGVPGLTPRVRRFALSLRRRTFSFPWPQAVTPPAPLEARKGNRRPYLLLPLWPRRAKIAQPPWPSLAVLRDIDFRPLTPITRWATGIITSRWVTLVAGTRWDISKPEEGS